ncbi:MAG TPA: carboxypeptidase regulatory-like domain-containing protein [Gemmatimonas sp.]|nr:carboxypeptidase regulatory-like domain-containing protein [Gemmatimonas sp.]
MSFKSFLSLATLLLPALACSLFPSPLQAQQTGGTATLRGTIRAQNGRPLVAATVRVLDGGASAGTDSAGRFTLTVGAGTRLQLAAQQVGFAAETLEVSPVAAGTVRSIGFTLAPLATLAVQQVVAQRDRPLLNTSDAATGGAVERGELRALPTDARDPIPLAFNIPGVAQARAFFGDAPKLSINATNALYTSYTIDGLDNNEGFLGGPRVEFPLAALARLEVMANSYSTAFGRSPSGVVNYETRAGGERWEGEVFAYNRPGLPLDARPALKPSDARALADLQRAQEGFRRTQVGGSFGGPVARERTYLFGALEYSNENEDRISSTARATFLGRELRETYKAFGRLDHGWNDQQTTTLRFAMSRQARAGEGSGIVAPEADITTIRFGTITGLTHRSSWKDGRASNTASAQLSTYKWDFPPTRSDFTRPQVTILDRDSAAIGVVGSSNFIFDDAELQMQFRNVYERQLGSRNTMSFGVDVTAASFKLTGSSTNPSGSYEVVNTGNIPLGPDGRYRFADIPANVFVRSYTIDAAQKQVDLTQNLYGAFLENRWRPSAALTVRYGVRWDYDDITSRGESKADLDNVQPRLSFNWVKGANSVVRGGAGIFTGKLPYAVYSDAVQFGPDGNQTVTFTGAQAPSFLQGPRTATLDRGSLPPGEQRRLFTLGLEQPSARQFTLGYQRQFGERTALSFDGVYVDTRNLPRSWDLNAQSRTIGASDTVGLPLSIGDASRTTRPVAGGYRRLTTTETGGSSTYAGLYTAVRHRATDRLLVDANWVWSHAISNTEDINFNASVGNDFALDRGDANNDRRHKITTRATYSALHNLTLSGIADFQTGTPINRVANRDLTGSGGAYGDGFIGNRQRYFGIARNGERLPSAFFLSGSVAYDVQVAGSALTFRGDVFNVLNTVNISGFATGVGGGGTATQIGRPGDPVVNVTASSPRQVQLSVGVKF